jgi:hypothetical protein
MGRVADDGDMATLLIIILAFAIFLALAVRYGTDSRHTDPRDLRPHGL